MKTVITTDLKNFKYKLEKFAYTNGLVEKVTKRLGDEYFTKVVELTPVHHNYSERFPPYDRVRDIGEKPRYGGDLRKAWKVDPVMRTPKGASVRIFNDLTVTTKEGKSYNLGTLVNDGHKQHVGQYIPPFRKHAKKPFIKGQHFVERANREFTEAMYDVIGNELNRQLRKALKND